MISRSVFLLRNSTVNKNKFLFSNVWRKRDEAEEKIYITKQQKQAMKKLLEKVEHQESDNESNLQEFERKLKEITRRYKIENPKLESQLSQLHRKLTH